jgi:hypothetical protein
MHATGSFTPLRCHAAVALLMVRVAEARGKPMRIERCFCSAFQAEIL